MSKLESLIQELCPNGVEYKSIKQLAEVGTGSSNGNEAQEDGSYPFFIRSQTVKRMDDWEYDEEAIIIPGEGGIGEIYHYVNGKYAIHQRVYHIHFVNEAVNVKFAFYYFRACFKPFILRKAVSATVKSIRKPMIEEFPIPVPPLPVQREIVRILDNFTELTAELTARKKQYEYYHNTLTNFVDRNDVEWVSVGDCFEFKNGINKGKEFFGKGSYIVNFTDVYNNRWLSKKMLRGRVITEPRESKAYSAQKGDVFFTRTSETKEDIGMVSTLIEDIDGCVFSGFVLRARPTTNHWIPKFCAYYFSSNIIRNEIVRYASFTTRALTSGPRLSKLKLSLLTISEQQRIVDILDRFDTLCNDISAGLPAEIAARQKQYEYYRDKLLTFKELT